MNSRQKIKILIKMQNKLDDDQVMHFEEDEENDLDNEFNQTDIIGNMS